MTEINEVWKPIPGFEGYEAKNTKRQFKTGLLTNKAGGIGRWKNHVKKSTKDPEV